MGRSRWQILHIEDVGASECEVACPAGLKTELSSAGLLQEL